MKAIDGLARQALAQLRADGLYRSLRRVERPGGARMVVDGREVLMFAGSNYLDLSADPRVIAGATSALEECGSASGGSRLISGNLRLHEALEAALAAFCGTEGALVFGSGYLANLGVVTALAGEGDVVVSDALNHASIIDACRLSRAEVRVFAHNDPQDFERVARGLSGFRRRVLIVDGVYSMDGDVARLGALMPLARAHDMLVVVDDAHGVGVLGRRGRGVVELEDAAPDLVIGNLAKAFGSYGAFVACSAAVREWLVNVARTFIFTCALPPASLGAALAALDVLEREPQRRVALAERAAQLRLELERAGFDTGRSSTHIVPAILGDNSRVMRLCELALEQGVYVQGIRYPSVPKGTARLRFTPVSAHSAADVTTAVTVLAQLAASV